MRIPRTFQAFGLLAFLVPNLALGSNYDKTVPLHPNKLSHYSGEQLFDAAFQGYVCSFLMHLAGQQEKGQFLRNYSVTLMKEDNVKRYGKHWNDVNFPGALLAWRLADQYAKQLHIPQSAAAGRLLDEDPKCQTLNRFTERALKNGINRKSE